MYASADRPSMTNGSSRTWRRLTDAPKRSATTNAYSIAASAVALKSVGTRMRLMRSMINLLSNTALITRVSPPDTSVPVRLARTVDGARRRPDDLCSDTADGHVGESRPSLCSHHNQVERFLRPV